MIAISVESRSRLPFFPPDVSSGRFNGAGLALGLARWFMACVVRRTGARAVSVPSGIVQSHPSNGQGIAMLPNGGPFFLHFLHLLQIGGWALNRVRSSFYSRVVSG